MGPNQAIFIQYSCQRYKQKKTTQVTGEAVWREKNEGTLVRNKLFASCIPENLLIPVRSHLTHKWTSSLSLKTIHL